MNPIPNKPTTLEDFKTGAILLVDKPLGWTSFQVVNKLRWIIRKSLGVKKIKVGHAGTLDPLASGLLVICTGKMTKEIQSFINDKKGYTGEFSFGKITDSYDLETELKDEKPVDFLTQNIIQDEANTFLGETDQRPPIFSAKKIDGKRAYELARAGIEVEMKMNKIEIDQFHIHSFETPDAAFEVHCSKGTYIRSIANDIGEKLGCGAHLKALRRIKSGSFDVNDAQTIEELEKLIHSLPKE